MNIFCKFSEFVFKFSLIIILSTKVLYANDSINPISENFSEETKVFMGLGTEAFFQTTPYQDPNIPTGVNNTNFINGYGGIYSIGCLVKNKFEFAIDTRYSNYELINTKNIYFEKQILLTNITGIVKVNYYLDKLKVIPIRPYFSLGVGLSNILSSIESRPTNGIDTLTNKMAIIKPAYQIEAGVSTQYKHILLALGLKIFGTNQIQPNDWNNFSTPSLFSGPAIQLFTTVGTDLKLLF